MRFCRLVLLVLSLVSSVYAFQPAVSFFPRDTMIVNAWYRRARASLHENVRKSDDLINRAWKTSIDLAYDQGIADGYYYTGCVYDRKGERNVAKRYFERAVSLYVEGRFLTNLPDAYRKLGVIYMAERRYYAAFEHFLNGMRAAERKGDVRDQVELSLELADYHNTVSKDYNEARATLEGAERLIKEKGYVLALGPLYLQYGVAFARQRDYETALRYCRMAQQHAGDFREAGDHLRFSALLVEAEVHEKTQDTARLGGVLNQLLPMLATMKDPQLEASYEFLKTAQCYFQRDYEQVLARCDELRLRFADEGKEQWSGNWQALRLLQAKALYVLGNRDRADQLLDEYEYTNDSLYSAQYIGQGREMSESYKLEKFERQIKEQELRLSNTSYQRRGLLAGIVVLLVILLILYVHFREKDRLAHRVALKNSEISVQNEILKQANKQNELLLREIHHRVKNNLQIISSLLSLQSRKSSNKELIAMMQESSSRINSIALIHTKLYQQQSLNQLDIQDYIEQLGIHLLSVYNVGKKDIQFYVDANGVSLDIDTAIPLGLILTELMTNSLKYAFTDRPDGEIYVQVHHRQEKKYQLVFKDNGVGIPDEKLKQTEDTLGVRLIHSLTRQLGGNLQYTFGEFSKYTIHFKG